VADGLANDFVNLAYCDHRGTLWFGNLNGLLRLFPESDRPSTRSRAAPDDGACPTALRFVTRKSCEVVLARGNAITWDFTAPAEGAVIRAVVNPASFDPHIISSLEILEGGRTTHFINPNVIDP